MISTIGSTQNINIFVRIFRHFKNYCPVNSIVKIFAFSIYSYNFANIIYPKNLFSMKNFCSFALLLFCSFAPW